MAQVQRHEREIEKLKHDLNGNGDMGLKQRVSRAESHLYTNPKTDDPGLVRSRNEHAKLIADLIQTQKRQSDTIADIRQSQKAHDEIIVGVRAQMRLLSWLIGVFGTGGIIWFLRAVFGPVG